MSVIRVEQLSKSYGEKVLFDRISFTIGEKMRAGLIGLNGTGKSSLLHIVAGLESPDAGEVLTAKSMRVEYLPQNPVFEAGGTVLEQVFFGDSPLMRALRQYESALTALERDATDEKLQRKLFDAQQAMDAADAWGAETEAKTVLNRLGIRDVTQDVGQLSGGQRKRVAMARALIRPADLLIMDEPTNHLDNETIEWLEGVLLRFPGALLLVTHDRYFLDRVTNRILELDRGKLFAYEGNYGVFLEKKAEREEQEAASESKRQNLLRRELAWLRRGAKARTTKQKARIDRAEALRDQKQDGPREQIELVLGSTRLGKRVFELKDVSKGYPGWKLLDRFSYLVQPGARIGIIGPNGSGKSTLLNMLAGRLEPDSGEIEIGQTVKTGYYTQESTDMNPRLRVIDYVKEGAEVIRTTDGEAITASQMLERFLFPPHQQWTTIDRLSGGERRRLYLLRILMTEPNVLLLDEPTNDLDIQTLTILEEYLEHFPGTVISVSHDRYFLDRTADILLCFEGEGSVKPFFGSYSDYLEGRQAALLAERNAQSPTSAASTAGVSKASDSSAATATAQPLRKLSFKDQKEWDGIEERIAELEGKLEETKRKIEQAGSDYDAVRDLYAEEQKLNDELERTMERWGVLAELVEQIEKNKG
ncbi:ABC-F family ATP-binding cassette domain-containing protein [Paenibacillus koleovorans]|uniref:ABC-F family ATP-binding cassette domain-containing protein n=1 Tax=Paenibacillus koleovorans TaxID=121608 RepID=UPI000FD84D86|nr:ABC-F family ATP-binding cassette domain-containing protein [Paenibacillus koleovorans]